MSRALVWHHRRPDATWWPVGVFLGTASRLDGMVLPGDPERERWFRTILDDASLPSLRPYDPTLGTWEDWIGWALGSMSNGHDSMMVEVDPEPTAAMLYQREVLGIIPTPLGVPGAASEDVPTGLGGYKAVKVSPGPGQTGRA